MTMTSTHFYTMKQAVSPEQEISLLKFLDSRETDTHLLDLVLANQTFTTCLYRGIQYPLRDLLSGKAYKHWDTLSSWSTDEDVARQFHQQNYVPEHLVENMLIRRGVDMESIREYGTEWNEALEEFVPVIFVLRNESGFSVNAFVDHVAYSEEKEFILYEGEWRIEDVVETYDVYGQRFYVAELT